MASSKCFSLLFKHWFCDVNENEIKFFVNAILILTFDFNLTDKIGRELDCRHTGSATTRQGHALHVLQKQVKVISGKYFIIKMIEKGYFRI